MDQSLSTPSPFKRRDLIPRTPNEINTFHRRAEWSATLPVISPNEDGSAYRQVDIFKRPDALTPENSSEEDREVEETPIYLRSERFRESLQLQNGRYTPNSPHDEQEEEEEGAGYDDSILRAYHGNNKRYSITSENGGNHSARSSPDDQRQYESSSHLYYNNKRNSITRRDITPSKIPIFQASPK